jgi:hypothetical protein
MSRGVIFLNIGTKCLVRLAASIHSLRKFYGGPVCIINAAGTDGGILEKFSADSRLSADVRNVEITTYRRRSAYVAKPSVYKWTPFDRSLFVDADTVFRGDPSPLFDLRSPFVVTQFSNWICSGSIVRSRIEPFFDIQCEPLNVPELARRSINERWPAINTGVFAFDRQWSGMKHWERLTQAARTRANFTDEIACQVLLPEFGSDASIVGDDYNWSPLYGKSESPLIVHMHGSKHLRPEAMPFWMPEFKECVDRNIAGINSWMPAGDSRLSEFCKSAG